MCSDQPPARRCQCGARLARDNSDTLCAPCREKMLADADVSARIAEALDELGRGEVGVDLGTMRAVLARRRAGA